MPPSTRSRPSVQAPPDRIYESTTPLAQAKLPPIRQRVYGRHSLGAPLTKKRQGTLTQIGFVNPERIKDEIAEYEKEEMERTKRQKTEGGTPLRRGLRAKPVIEQRDTPTSGTRLRQMMDKQQVEMSSRADVMPAQLAPAQLRQQEPVQRLDDTSEPEAGEGWPKKKRKSRKGITIGVKTLIIKVESPEAQTQYHTQSLHHLEEQEGQEETQGEDINRVMDSFQSAPSFEEEKKYESYVRMEAEQVEEAQRRKNRVIPDSDAESEDESIVYDSNDDARNGEVPATPAEQSAEPVDNAVPRGGSDVDLDEIKDSLEEKANFEQDLDKIPDITEEDKPELDLDLKREIPDSQAESEDDEDIDLDMPEPTAVPRPTLKQEDTLILNSFSVPSSGSPAVQPRLKSKLGPDSTPESFSMPGSPTVNLAEQQPAIIKDSFYQKQPPLPQDSSFERLAQPAPSPIPEEEVDFVPSSSAVSIPDLVHAIPDVAAMPPPPVTPRKPRRTEIPNTGSTCSPLSTQSTIRSMTPNSGRSKRYNQSPTKAYNRSPLKRLTENNLLSGALSLPRLRQSPSKKQSSMQLRESQISTQGTPTQRGRVSQVFSFVKPESDPHGVTMGNDGEDEEYETTIIPESPTPIKSDRNDTQKTTDTNSPSRQIHSEISAALSSEHNPPPSSGRTIRLMKTHVKDSQTESDDEEFDDGEYHHSIEKPQVDSNDEIYDDGEYHHSVEEESMEIVVEGDRIQNPSSKPVTPRVVRFQSIPAAISAQLQFHSSPVGQALGSSPAAGSNGTQASSMNRPSIVGAETQMRSQWLGSDALSSDNGELTQGNGGTMGESQWLGDLLPESLMAGADDMSVPPIMDDDSVWDEFRSSRRSGVDEIED